MSSILLKIPLSRLQRWNDRKCVRVGDTFSFGKTWHRFWISFYKRRVLVAHCATIDLHLLLVQESTVTWPSISLLVCAMSLLVVVMVVVVVVVYSIVIPRNKISNWPNLFSALRVRVCPLMAVSLSSSSLPLIFSKLTTPAKPSSLFHPQFHEHNQRISIISFWSFHFHSNFSCRPCIIYINIYCWTHNACTLHCERWTIHKPHTHDCNRRDDKIKLIELITFSLPFRTNDKFCCNKQFFN